MDVANEAAVNAGVATVVKAFGGVDILVSNAGIQIVHPLEEFPYAEWKKMLAIHLDGAFLTTRACLPHMYRRGAAGASSTWARCTPRRPRYSKAPYVTAKHGLIGLAKVVAKEGAGARRACQRHLSGIRADAAGRQANSGAGGRRSAFPSKTSSGRSC